MEIIILVTILLLFFWALIASANNVRQRNRIKEAQNDRQSIIQRWTKLHDYQIKQYWELKEKYASQQAINKSLLDTCLALEKEKKQLSEQYVDLIRLFNATVQPQRIPSDYETLTERATEMREDLRRLFTLTRKIHDSCCDDRGCVKWVTFTEERNQILSKYK